jgi:hypothetical protein
MTTQTIKSRDGTTITYEKVGSGRAVVLVDGAFCRRTFGPMPDLAKALASKSTVYHYDRCGRGDSEDHKVYDPAREVEDLDAVVQATGEAPFLYGISSGAALALRAVASGVTVKKLVVFEVPFILDNTHTPDPPDFRERIGEMLQRDDRTGAIKVFMRVVGVPAIGIFFMRLMPCYRPRRSVGIGEHRAAWCAAWRAITSWGYV